MPSISFNLISGIKFTVFTTVLPTQQEGMDYIGDVHPRWESWTPPHTQWLCMILSYPVGASGFDQTHLWFCPRPVLTIGFEYSFSSLYYLSSLFIGKWSFWPKEIVSRRGICFKIINLWSQGPGFASFFIYILLNLKFSKEQRIRRNLTLWFCFPI